MVPLLIALIAVISVLIHLRHYKRYREFFRVKLPGPIPWPFIGNADILIRRSGDKTFDLVPYLTRNWETPLRVWLGPFFIVFVTKPKDVELVLNATQSISRPGVYDVSTSFFSPSVLTLRGMYRDL